MAMTTGRGGAARDAQGAAQEPGRATRLDRRLVRAVAPRLLRGRRDRRHPDRPHRRRARRRRRSRSSATTRAGVASIIVALALWVALRAGAGGAPLAPEGPDVVYLAARADSQRPRCCARSPRTSCEPRSPSASSSAPQPASRPRRGLPSGPGVWALCGLLAGPCIAAAFWGAVALASARRFGSLVANGIGALLVAGAAADAYFHTWIAPSTWLASLTLLPLHGLGSAHRRSRRDCVRGRGSGRRDRRRSAGTSLEPLLQRSALDEPDEVRGLGAGHAHRRAASPPARDGEIAAPSVDPASRRRRKIRRPAWRRAWHGYARWPARPRRARRRRCIAAAGGLTYAARSTHLLIIFAGLALFIAALDIIEPFAAELDHPTALLTYGVSIRAVLLRNLAAPVAALVGAALFGAGDRRRRCRRTTPPSSFACASQRRPRRARGQHAQRRARSAAGIADWR